MVPAMSIQGKLSIRSVDHYIFVGNKNLYFNENTHDSSNFLFGFERLFIADKLRPSINIRTMLSDSMIVYRIVKPVKSVPKFELAQVVQVRNVIIDNSYFTAEQFETDCEVNNRGTIQMALLKYKN